MSNLEKRSELELKKVFPDFNKRKKRVSETEWQRWIPLLSLYRVAIDPVEDRVVRGSMYSRTYLFANTLFDLAQIAGLGISLYKLTEMLVR